MTRTSDDLVIDACRWHVNAEASEFKQRALAHFRDRYTVLLTFLRENRLLTDADFGLCVTDWLEFEIKKSDLTPEGFDLFRNCAASWNPSFGQAHTKRHLVQWKRRLAEMRGAA